MPKVVLIGDSIRMGYQDTVRQELTGVAEVLSPEENGGPSSRVRESLDDWVIALEPDIVHINCGLHDIKRDFETQTLATSLDDYRDNLRNIFSRLRDETDATIIWAATTPVNEVWHHERKGFDRLEDDVDAFNQAAGELCAEFEIPINDLFGLIMSEDRDTVLTPDGVHFSAAGSALLGRTVALKIKSELR